MHPLKGFIFSISQKYIIKLLMSRVAGDAPPNSLMDSIVSPKGESNKMIRSWALSLACNILRVKGRVGTPR
jgi:hypothetical protein